MDYFLSDPDNMGNTQNARDSIPIARSKAACCQRVWGDNRPCLHVTPTAAGTPGGWTELQWRQANWKGDLIKNQKTGQH